MIKRFFPKMRPLMRVSLLAALAFVTMTALCGWTSSCGSAIHKASVAADSIAASLHTAADLNHSLQASGQITLEERQQVALLIDQASQANDVFVGDLKAASANGTPVTAASITQAFSKFLTQLDALESNGVLHLKSAAAQAEFEKQLALIRAEVKVIQAVISVTSGENRSPERSPQSGGFLMFAALALTPEELETLIAMALSAIGEGASLVAKLKAMKGETDAELLDDALSEDAAARKQAQADEGSE